MVKFVRAKKIYQCVVCSGNIQKGERHAHVKLRLPRVEDDETQIGVIYEQYRQHERNCWPMLLNRTAPKDILKNCNHGNHSPVYDMDPDSCEDYYWCEWCGKELITPSK